MATSESKLWYLENVNLLKDMSKDVKHEVHEKTVMRTVNKGQFIYFPEEQSTNIYFLKKGRVMIGTYSDDGRELIKAYLQPGEMFGEMSLTGEGKRSDFAKAADNDTLICAMPLHEMQHLAQKDSSLNIRLTKFLGLRMKKLERGYESLLFKDSRTRIIDFLKEMAEESGEKVGLETRIKLNLTHSDIAKLTATSRQTVTTVLNDLKKSNLINFDRKKILIRDLRELA
ncbi:MAG: Crp/Fnr family transcriptional regulator [Bacteroidetes bacterium SW_11_45_7]|nr:MAG: Crp/Fnr family transcriptional regulator [Bacteroidetes bacterium SW_11_45_7]